MEITGSVNASSSILLVGENYTLKLKHSMQDLLAENRKQSPDFSLFVDAFYELMQANVDPPFEVIWVYAAITFRSRNIEKGDSLNRILDAKDLFQLLSACSASVGASKSIALLTPVVFEVHRVLLELFGRELRLKREKKAMREVKSLVDTVLGYISVCCSKIVEEETDSVNLNLILPFTDLACVWVNSNDGFESLLPLVASDVCNWLCISKEFHVAYLAGAVIMEAFLLKLCLSFHLAMPLRGELEMNLKTWAVGSISSFQNIYFLEILMRAALATPLPVSSILNRAISYIRAISASRIPSQIIKWVTSMYGLEEKAGRANGSSPRSLLNWLLSLENQGIRVFEDDILKSHAKSGLDISQAEQHAGNLEGKIADDDLFYVDDIGEERNTVEEDKQNELISDAFVAAAQTMKLTENGTRKRKGKSNENSYPVKAGTSAVDDSSSGESEVEDPVSDTDA